MLRSASASAAAVVATSTFAPCSVRTPALACARQSLAAASSSKCRLPDSPRTVSSGSKEGRRRRRRSKRRSGDETDAVQSESTTSTPSETTPTRPLNPVFTNSTASLRPLPNVRSPIFSKRPIIDSGGRVQSNHGGDGVSQSSQALLFSREQDETLRIMYSALGSSQSVKLPTLVRLCGEIADHMKRYQIKPNYIPYMALFEQLSNRGLLDECWQLMDDMQAAGLPPTLVALNYVLKAAVDAGDYDSIEKACLMINTIDPAQALPYDTYAKASTPEEQSKELAARKADDEARVLRKSKLEIAQAFFYEPGQLPPGICIDVRNFNSMTYAQLFRHALNDKKVDYALLLFSALVHSKASAIASFQSNLRSNGAEYLLQLLCRNHEYRLAVEIADWLDIEGVGRLVSTKTWMLVVRACAVGGYFPGVKLGWQRTVTEDAVVPDEGLLLAALAVAAREPDSDFCLEILRCHLSNSSAWRELAEAEDAPPPLQHVHLVPLLEAFATEGKYRELTRLAGAMAHWGIELDESTFGPLVRQAGQSPDELAKAISEWQRVIDEGLLDDQQQQQSSSSSSSSSSGASSTTPRTVSGREKTEIIDRVSHGKIASLRGAVETHTMNALIRAAAELGESEEALNIWEERRYVKSRAPPLHISSTQEHTSGKPRGPLSVTDHRMAGNPQGEYYPIRPSIETFNALLLATVNRDPAGTNLAVSIFKELKDKFPSIAPDALTFERLIAVHLVPSSRPEEHRDGERFRTNQQMLTSHTRNAPQAFLVHMNRAFDYFEQCKEHGLTPTRFSYDILIRASIRREEDIRWIDLTREMVREAGYLVPLALSEFIRAAENSRRSRGRLGAYEHVWESYVEGNVLEGDRGEQDGSPA